MNDRQIQQLIRMAGEIETVELEQASVEHSPVFHIQPRPADRFRLVRALTVGGIAAAVLLAGVAVTTMSFPGRPPAQPTRIAQLPAATEHTPVPVKAEDDRGCVVLTMFNDGEKCNCVQMQTHELDGLLEEVPRAELIEMALQSPCSTTAQRVVVLAVAGRKDALPKTREDAEALAARIGASSGPSDVASDAYAAMPALGADATVIAETVAWKRPSMPLDNPAFQDILGR